MRVTIWLCRSRGIRAAFRRLLLASPWDYCAVEMNEDVYELHPKSGSIVRNWELFSKENPVVTSVVVGVPDPDSTLRYLDGTTVKPSKLAKWPLFPLRRWRRSKVKLLPAEYIANALENGGLKLDLPANRVTPVLLWSQLPVLHIHFRRDGLAIKSF